ncbi:MAG: hypothetical protein GY854_10150 [Deltaproteobacteria bacterium]|nr:hypothetical protein [Deltaproteobacteria bacterium]
MTKKQFTILVALFFLVNLTLTSCKDGKKSVDAGPDASLIEDSGPDTDTEEDSGPDTDTNTDTDTDTGPEEDAGKDAEPDAEPQPEPDAGYDAGPDLGCVRFVDINATSGTEDGLSWENAYVELQPAIDDAKLAAKDDSSIDYCAVWVAAGTYIPTEIDEGSLDERTASFKLGPFVHLYGGFDPAAGADMLDERIPLRNKTILSGDIQSDSKYGNNAYHVVEGVSDALIDGFIITGGYADGESEEEQNGGGMYVHKATGFVIENVTFLRNMATNMGGGVFITDNATPEIKDCTFQLNSAEFGGGMANSTNSSPTISYSEFSLNEASNGGGIANLLVSNADISNSVIRQNKASLGGGMYNSASAPILNDCVFDANKATSESVVGTESGGAMYNTGSAVKAVGCTFSSNTAEATGGAVHNVSCPTPEFTRCRFESNAADIGGGVYNSASNTVAKRSFFWNNSAITTGGGMHNESSSPSLIGCTFQSNSSQDDGGGLYNSTSPATLTNCVFTNNFTTEDTNHNGGGVYNLDSSPKITNCTFYGNLADHGGGIHNYNSASVSNPVIVNSIIWANSAYTDGAQIYNNGGLPVPDVTYSNIQDGYAGTENINIDPLFQNADAGNLRLQFKSPCVDEGNDLEVAQIPEDIDGNNRIIGEHVDMGADEMAFLFVDHEASGDGSGLSWGNAFTDLESALLAADYGYQVLVAEGTYKPTTPADRAATFTLVEGISIYGGFNPEIPDPGDAGVPDSGIDAGPDSGPPEPEATFADRDFVTYETILSGDIGAVGDSSDNSYHVVTGSKDSLIDGFVITGGNANGADDNGYGGGMFNSAVSPTVKNTRLYANSAVRGGGMANLNHALPTLDSCIFDDNIGTYYGGGMYNSQSSPILFNSIFKCNSSNAGGGMANEEQASPEIVNCTFQGNDADFGGGIYNSGSYPVVVNSIIWGNTADSYGPGCYVFGDVSYSNVEGICDDDVNCGGINNMDEDPKYKNDNPSDGEIDLHLDLSPCVDTGNNAAVLSNTDLDGNDRIVSGHGGGQVIVDMGAYEYQRD